MKTLLDISAVLVGLVVGVALFLGIMAAYIAMYAFTLATMWGWFVVPTFTLQPLTYVQAAGPILIWHALHAPYMTDEEASKERVKRVAWPFMVCGLYLLVGWILHHYWM